MKDGDVPTRPARPTAAVAVETCGITARTRSDCKHGSTDVEQDAPPENFRRPGAGLSAMPPGPIGCGGSGVESEKDGLEGPHGRAGGSVFVADDAQLPDEGAVGGGKAFVGGKGET